MKSPQLKVEKGCTIQERIRRLKLGNTYFSNPEVCIEELMQWVLECSWSELILNLEGPWPLNKEALLRSSWARLQKGEPLAYIRGDQDFYKFSFKVNPHVLIPRSETEKIVEKCLEYGKHSCPHSKPKVFDLGTGSGCIGLSLAKEWPEGEFWLFDSSEKALEVAQDNAQRLQVGDCIHWVHGSVGEGEDLKISSCQGKVDFVLANPPYIALGDSRVDGSVHNFEPHGALYCKNQGLEWIHKWLQWSYDYMRMGGYGIFELGFEQGPSVKKSLKTYGYTFKELVRDNGGRARCVVFQKELFK